MSTVDINVHHVTRVEGHGNIRVRASDGKLECVEWQIVESPRFFEAMIVGRRWFDVSHITSRICGICSRGHTTASVRATEKIFGVKISHQSLLLRKLLLHSEHLQSHVLHYYFLAAPDLLKAGSVFPLAKTHPEVVARALRLKKFANWLGEVLAGRPIHPISLQVGGMAHCPTVAELKEVRRQLTEQVIPDLEATVDLFASLQDAWPKLNRPTEYMALRSENEYALYEGKLTSTDAGSIDESEYPKFIHEKVVPHSTAKHAYNKRSSYMVGALARYKINHDKLHPAAAEAAGKMGLTPECVNPFFNNVAQVVETVHCAHDSVRIVDELLSMPLQQEQLKVEPRAGEGAAIVEVPRGLLVHNYWYNDEGIVEKSNLVIPTGQNCANIEDDMRAFVPQIIDQGQEKVQFQLEMLVRAYDPCISCSAHLLDVEFV